MRTLGKQNCRRPIFGQRFVEELRHLRELPQRNFEARKVELVSVSRRSTVRIEGATYSVPSQWASLRATAYIGVEDVRIHCRGQSEIYPRERKGSQKIRYRHYLAELAKKAQAVRQVAPELHLTYLTVLPPEHRWLTQQVAISSQGAVGIVGYGTTSADLQSEVRRRAALWEDQMKEVEGEHSIATFVTKRGLERCSYIQGWAATFLGYAA
jgi:hypothetical protein